MTFKERFDSFLYRYEWARELAADLLREWGQSSTDCVIREVLEVTWRSRSEASKALLQSWYIFRASQRGDHWQELRREVGLATDDDVVSVFDLFDSARLGAFRIRKSKSGWKAAPLDGDEAADSLQLRAVTDFEFTDLATTPRIIAGWLIDLNAATEEGQPQWVIIEAVKLPEKTSSMLKDAAGRSAWGTAETFRRDHYEEDILSLLLHPDVMDTGLNWGRIFLEARFYYHFDYYRRIIVGKLSREIRWNGFSSLRGNENRLFDEGPKSPRSDLANSSAENFDALRQDLDFLRVNTFHKYSFYGDLIGPQSAQFLLPDDEFLRGLGLHPDGTVQLSDDVDEDLWQSYRLYVLDLDTSWLRSNGLAMDWTIAQALAWGRSNLSAHNLEVLTLAVEKHHRAIGWAHLLRRPNNTESADSLLPHITYDELILGLDRHLPKSVGDQPIDALPHPTQKPWTSISGRLRRGGVGTDGEPICIKDLPRSSRSMVVMQGFGPKSWYILTEGLKAFCSNWPESAGHRPVAFGDSTARDGLSQGLDELSNLF